MQVNLLIVYVLFAFLFQMTAYERSKGRLKWHDRLFLAIAWPIIVIVSAAVDVGERYQ